MPFRNAVQYYLNEHCKFGRGEFARALERYGEFVVLITIRRGPPAPPLSLYGPILPPITAHHRAV